MDVSGAIENEKDINIDKETQQSGVLEYNWFSLCKIWSFCEFLAADGTILKTDYEL